MRKRYLLIILLGFVGTAQTGIGTTTPDASAKLDVSASNKGFLPPRVTLTSTSDTTTIASPATGLLVYNVGSSGLQAGYYYWNGTSWATIVVAFGNLPTPGDVKSGFQVYRLRSKPVLPPWVLEPTCPMLPIRIYLKTGLLWERFLVLIRWFYPKPICPM
jgi:hypothetical protein